MALSDPIERRTLSRQAYCRGCDKKVEAGEDMIYTYSIRNKGQHIYFCLPCARKMGRLAQALKRVLRGTKIDG